MVVCFALHQNVKVIPVDVMSSGFDVVSILKHVKARLKA